MAPIREEEPSVQIWSDANLTMGGAHNSRGQFQQRLWTEEEQSHNFHINLLELRAAREALSLTNPGDMVRLHVDPKTAAGSKAEPEVLFCAKNPLERVAGQRSDSPNTSLAVNFREYHGA